MTLRPDLDVYEDKYARIQFYTLDSTTTFFHGQGKRDPSKPDWVEPELPHDFPSRLLAKHLKGAGANL